MYASILLLSCRKGYVAICKESVFMLLSLIFFKSKSLNEKKKYHCIFSFLHDCIITKTLRNKKDDIPVNRFLTFRCTRKDVQQELPFHLKEGTLKDYLGYFTATEPALIVQGRYWRAAQGRRDLLEIPIYAPHTYWFLTPSSNEKPRGIIYLAGFAVRRSQSA